MIRLIPALSVAACLCASVAHAQSATYSVVAPFPGDATVGGQPDGQLVQLPTGLLYGSTLAGGKYGEGTQYSATVDGVLSGIAENCGGGVESCGVPASFIIEDGSFFIGTTEYGGDAGYGYLYYTEPYGYQGTVLQFTGGQDGGNPTGVLMETGNRNLYGETTTGGTPSMGDVHPCDGPGGGDTGCGTIYEYSPDETFSTLYSFTNGSDGAHPAGGLVQGRDGNFYGVTQTTFFKITPTGTLTTYTNNTDTVDTAYVGPPVEDSAGNFYFAATSGSGSTNGGGILKAGTDGTISSLHRFCSLANCMDGSTPGAPAMLTNGNLIGFTSGGGNLDCSGTGGVSGCGTVFELTTAGTLTTLYSFDSANSNGYKPISTPISGMDGNLYGVTQMGGLCASCGVLYKLVHSPALLPAVQLTATKTTVEAGSAATLTVTANQANSETAQTCFATGVSGNGTFKSLLGGTYKAATGVFSGGALAEPNSPGVFPYGVICGGTVSGSTTVTFTTATTTVVAATPNPAYIGSTVSATATTTENVGGMNAYGGTVTFSVGGIVLETVASDFGVATLTASTAGLQPGNYALVASYSGQSYDLSSTGSTNVVLQQYGTTTTIGDTPTAVTPPADIKFTAKVTANNKVGLVPPGSVTFSSNGRTLATVALNNGVAVYLADSTGVPPGTYPVVATYNPLSTTYARSQSATVNATVK